MVTFMRSYLDMLTELKETLENDAAMPEIAKIVINNLIDRLFSMLWRYSD